MYHKHIISPLETVKYCKDKQLNLSADSVVT